MKCDLQIKAVNNHFKKKYLPQIILFVLLIISLVVISFTSPYFLKWYNIKNILDQSAINILLGVSMTLVICSGGLDLSVGSIAALSSVVMALAIHSGFSLEISIFICILVGTICGLINGYIISCININPFIVTISTLWIYRALTLVLTNSSPIYGFPNEFSVIGSGSFMGLPISFIITLGVVIFGTVLFHKTKYGKYMIAFGCAEASLKRVGVSVNLYKISVYVFSGILAAVTGIILTSKLNCADPLAGYMLEMEVISIVILGGTSIKGGRASIVGTLIAGLLMGMLRNGLIMNGIASYYQQLLVGLILIFAVILSERDKLCKGS